MFSTLLTFVSSYFIPLTLAVVVGVVVAYISGLFERPFRFIYGDLTRNEASKFLLYGVLLLLIIGIYWELRCVKDAIFNAFIGSKETGWAKLLSLAVVFPLVIGYSYLVDLFPRQRLFYAIAAVYAACFFALALLLNNESFGMAAPKADQWQMLGWISYVMIESFGTLVVSLFYAFMADTTTPEAGKKGYFITATFAQVGAILGSKLVATQAKCYGVPYLMTIASALILLIPALVYFILWYLPKDELAGYQAKATGAHGTVATAKKEKPGFVDGLKLMFSEKYLFAIFFIICAFEIIATVFDLQFKILIAEFAKGDNSVYAAYSGEFGVTLSLLALYSLLLGLGKIGRKIGIMLSLALMPLLMGVNIFIMTGAFMGWFSFLPVLTVVFWIQVISKGINYALGQPSKEQLFIPTSKEAKYKSKAWVDMFGSRFSKASGSGIKIFEQNMMEWGYFATVGASTAFLMGSSAVICAVWFFVALYAGRTNREAVAKNEIVC